MAANVMKRQQALVNFGSGSAWHLKLFLLKTRRLMLGKRQGAS